ncbi:hypothetical protein NL676_005685 [Syzygium grande]|nr:hypothetical protein NL676_005685 [Syzygium grande]
MYLAQMEQRPCCAFPSSLSPLSSLSSPSRPQSAPKRRLAGQLQRQRRRPGHLRLHDTILRVLDVQHAHTLVVHQPHHLPHLGFLFFLKVVVATVWMAIIYCLVVFAVPPMSPKLFHWPLFAGFVPYLLRLPIQLNKNHRWVMDK